VHAEAREQEQGALAKLLSFWIRLDASDGNWTSERPKHSITVLYILYLLNWSVAYMVWLTAKLLRLALSTWGADSGRACFPGG
jgi:hypothetical protein